MAEGRRPAPYVDHDVGYGPRDDPNKLPLAVRRELLVEPAQDSLGRDGMVFLDKGHRTSHRLIEQALVKCLEKLTPVIGKNHGFEDHNVFNVTSGRQHQKAISVLKPLTKISTSQRRLLFKPRTLNYRARFVYIALVPNVRMAIGKSLA